MSFGAPLWLLGLPVVAAAAWICARRLRRVYHRRLRLFVNADHPYLSVDPRALRVQTISLLMLFAALGCLIAALARPQGARRPAAGGRTGVNLIILVDASRSMACEDILPSRLEVARQAAQMLSVEAAGSRLALIMFGGAPTLLIPFTFDPAAVSVAVRSVSPELAGKGGTALGAAIRRAAEYSEKFRGQPRVVVIISDGEEGEGDPLLTVMQLRAQERLMLHSVTVGTERGGPIPLYGRDEQRRLTRMGVLQDREKRAVITRARPDVMAGLAKAGGGQASVVTAASVAAEMKRLHTEFILPHAKPIDDALTEVRGEYFGWALALGAALLAGELILRRASGPLLARWPETRRRGAVLAGLENSR